MLAYHDKLDYLKSIIAGLFVSLYIFLIFLILFIKKFKILTENTSKLFCFKDNMSVSTIKTIFKKLFDSTYVIVYFLFNSLNNIGRS